eukprot:Amastigsp_a933_3.p2 type:complete len:121 gc:universal Amastigsp_a933_3:535-173(-)
MAPPPGSATTWFVRNTATLNSSASLASLESIALSFCWRSASWPRPQKSTRNSDVIESTMSRRMLPSSAICAAALSSISNCCSCVYTRTVRMFSSTSSGSSSYRDAISTMRCGRNVPSVSM